MSKKQDKAILRGFASGGASDVQLTAVGKGYRRVTMVVAGHPCTVFKVPTSSHLDERGVQRKARDIARRFLKYETTTLTW